LLVVAGLILLLAFMPRDEWLPIDKISIRGQFEQLDTKALQQQLESYLGRGFFNVDIAEIQQQISQQPWISSVSVRRVWPNQLSVRVQEKKAFARWDDDHLLSTEAIVYAADSHKFSELPLINGYTGDSMQLLKRYVELKQRFAEQGIELNALIEDSKGALSLTLDKRLQVSLGSNHNDLKIRHLLAVYSEQIRNRSEQIEHIDFRYSNGFAIAWKKEYLEKMGQQQRGNKNV
jgi:cell division protein FtsQ